MFMGSYYNLAQHWNKSWALSYLWSEYPIYIGIETACLI